jgi:hypothetical protein
MRGNGNDPRVFELHSCRDLWELNQMPYFGLALAVAFVCVLVGRALGLSRETIAAIAFVPTFLTLVPFLKRYAPKLTFSVWVLGVVIGAVVAGVLFYVFR